MNIENVRKNAFAMPFTSPSGLKIDYRFVNREYLIISYETDYDALRAFVPEPLKVVSNIVKFEFMKMKNVFLNFKIKLRNKFLYLLKFGYIFI